MELVSLRAFQAIVERGSLTAAARALTYAPSTVSGKIHALERSLGAELFDRGQRTLVPAADGRRLPPYVKAIMQILDFARAVLRVDRTNTWIGLPDLSNDRSESPKTRSTCYRPEANW
jgi:DNA-binding transcriptional LysR family regulator